MLRARPFSDFRAARRASSLALEGDRSSGRFPVLPVQILLRSHLSVPHPSRGWRPRQRPRPARRQSPAVVPGRLVRVALFLPAAPVALPAARFLSSARGCTLAQTRSARPSFTSRSCGLGRGEREPDDRVVVVGTRHAILTAGSAGSDTGWGGRRSGMKRKWPGSCRVLPPLKSTSSVGMAPLPRRRRRGGRVLGF